jgi:hypothetical protein
VYTSPLPNSHLAEHGMCRGDANLRLTCFRKFCSIGGAELRRRHRLGWGVGQIIQPPNMDSLAPRSEMEGWSRSLREALMPPEKPTERCNEGRVFF